MPSCRRGCDNFFEVIAESDIRKVLIVDMGEAFRE
jgi:hypothetical protein